MGIFSKKNNKKTFTDKVNETINDIFKLYDISKSDEQDRQVVAAYIFGIITGIMQKNNVDSVEVQAKMIEIMINKLNYSAEQAGEFSQYLINSTDKAFHPTFFTIIHRGLEAYLKYDTDYSAIVVDLEIVVITVAKSKDKTNGLKNIEKFAELAKQKEYYVSAGPSSDEDIELSEKKLSLKFSEQNRYFYKNIGYCSYFGHEFFGIRPNNSSGVLEGSSVAYALNDREEYGLPVDWIPLKNLDDGEMAYLDYSNLNQNGEPRIISAFYNGDKYEISSVLAEDLGDYLYEIVQED